MSKHQIKGFTLIEVMVAMAIMALSLLVLFQIQARSIRLADQARQLTTAVGLAKSKLYDCKYLLLKRGLGISDFHEEGKFDDPAFAAYTWECQSHRFNLAIPDVQKLSSDATQKAGKLNIPGMDLSAAALGPFLNMLVDPIKDSIRELVITIRWKNGDTNEDMQVATHVVDPKALSILLQSLPGSTQPEAPSSPPPPGGQPPESSTPPSQAGGR